MSNVYLIIIDGLGCGAQEDAAQYGDEAMNTLGHVSEETGVRLPSLAKMGLGNIIPLPSVPPEPQPSAAWGKMREVSAGKDSTTGHWEIAGIQLQKPFPVYPEGFPDEVVRKFCEGVGVKEVLCNKPYSGTEVIKDYGKKHLQTGFPILYTSADSVFQLAAHEDIIPVSKLYEWCEYAREKVCVGEHGVGRVIARPFKGNAGALERISDKRHDFSRRPPDHNLLTLLQKEGIKTYSIGKVVDLFAEDFFTQFRRTRHNAEGIAQLLSAMSAVENSFVFVNLIDTDQLYGHRLDPEGYAQSLAEFDRALPAIRSKLKEGDLLMITGDHGNDPCSQSTDHSREFVPLLIEPGTAAGTPELGIRGSFADVAATVADFFKIDYDLPGTSCLRKGS